MPPKNIYQDTGNTMPPPVQNTGSVIPQGGVAPVIPPPKKGIPKIIIYAAIGLGLIILLILLLRLFTGAKKKASGEVIWWGLWEDQATVGPLISAYETANPGVKITYVRQSQQDYRERLTSALAKGTGPDIFTIHNSWVPMFRTDLDGLPASVMNASDFAKTFYGIASSDLTVGNSIVGIPLEYDALTLYINQDIFDKAGKKPPTTWDDFRVLAKELTIKNEQNNIVQAGAALGRTENVDHWQEILALMMIQNNVDLTNPSGTNAEGAITFFTNFSAFDGVWDETLPPSTQAFAAGKLAMYIAPSWRAFEILHANPNLKFKTVPIPQLPKDNPNEPDITYATYWVQSVWSKSSNKIAAWNFLKFLSTQDSLQKLYKNESATRAFGEPYPRVDMAALLKDHPLLGSIILQAPGARSWYLDSRTFDGPTGINSQMANYFGDAINAVTTGKQTATKALEPCVQGVRKVLSQYKLLGR